MHPPANCSSRGGPACPRSVCCGTPLPRVRTRHCSPLGGTSLATCGRHAYALEVRRDGYASGGAGDEAGGEYRRAVAALFAAYGLIGVAFPGLPLAGPAVVEGVALETDYPIDDIVAAT